MTGRRSAVRALVAAGWRLALAWFVLTYLWRSLVILAVLVALAVALVAAAVAAGRALLVRRRGW